MLHLKYFMSFAHLQRKQKQIKKMSIVYAESTKVAMICWLRQWYVNRSSIHDSVK